MSIGNNNVLTETPRLELPVWTLFQGASENYDKSHDFIAMKVDRDSKFMLLFTNCHHAAEYAATFLQDGTSLLPEALASRDHILEALKNCEKDGATHVLLDPTPASEEPQQSYQIGQFIREFETHSSELSQ